MRRLPPLAAWLHQRQHLATFTSTLLPTVGALVLQLVAFAITARGLGVAQFGVYTAVLSITAVAVDVVGLGATDLMMRAVATNRSSFSNYWRLVLQWTAWSWPLACLVGLGVGTQWMAVHLPWPLMALALAAEVLVARISASTELVMVAHEQPVRAAWVRVGTVAARLLVAASYFLAFAQRELAGWIFVVAGQSVLVAGAYVWLVQRLYGGPSGTPVSGELAAGLSFCITQVARSAQGNLDRIVLARFGTEAALGAYGAATRFMQLGMFPIQVATRMLYPKFFQVAKGGIGASRAFGLKAGAAMLAVGCFAAVAVALAGALAPWVLGEDYRPASHYVWILALALPFLAAQYPAADTLTAVRRQALRASLSLGATLLMGSVLLICALLWGAEGVAWGFVVACALVASVFWGAALRCTRLKGGIAV